MCQISKGSKSGLTLIEVITSAAVLALLSLWLLAACYPIKTGIRQAGVETSLSNMAFAVLDAVRAEASDLDLDHTILFEDLDLSNPNNYQVTVATKQDGLLPDIYIVSVKVQEGKGNSLPVTMHTMVRKCNH